MDRKDAAKIRHHMEYIIENIDVSAFQRHLVGKGLKLEDVAPLDKETVLREKNRKCLECLIKPGNECASYEVLINILNDFNYKEVVKKLESGLPPGATAEKAPTKPRRILVPEHKRNINLSQKHLKQLSETVSPKDIRELATCLGLTAIDVDVIESDDPCSIKAQMMKLLFLWKSKKKGKCLGELMNLYDEAIENGVYIDIEKLEKIINWDIME
ncbi:uncharacterized protein LOC132561537 [Ylistrum balloti]|uniref:uncharacterized protein LOC132561537 n=1 Tax=Ylistrum balloti TaxID=509963 RepID=UPI0029057E8A|nr:uncharacterized protein LOC132561537 [Ylistrum balloti]